MKDKLGLGHMNPKTFPFHDLHLDPMTLYTKYTNGDTERHIDIMKLLLLLTSLKSGLPIWSIDFS